MRFQVEATVPPDVVFSEIADFANLENWDPLVRRSWCESGEPLHEGAVYVVDAPGGLSLEYRVVDIEQPRYVVYQGGTERVRSTDTIEVAPSDDGGSLVTVTSELRFLGWMRLMSPLTTGMVWLGGRLLSIPAMRRHLASLS